MKQFMILLSLGLIIGGILFGLYIYTQTLQGIEVKYGIWIVLGAELLGGAIWEKTNGKKK